MFNEKRFRLKVHQYGPGGAGEGGGGSPGGPGGPGGTGPGGPGPGGGPSGIGVDGAFGDFSGDFGDNGGTFGNFFGNLFSNYSNRSQRSDIDTILNMNPLTAVMNALVYGGTFATTGKGQTFGDLAQGDPAGGRGDIGGPDMPVSQTSRAITQAVAPPAPVAPPPPPAAPLADDRKRKRIGRQETILTSRSALSDAPTFRPTLLGQ